MGNCDCCEYPANDPVTVDITIGEWTASYDFCIACLCTMYRVTGVDEVAPEVRDRAADAGLDLDAVGMVAAEAD